MKYHLVLTSSAERELKKLPPQIQDEIFEKIESLQTNPRPQGYKKLTNFKVPNLKLKPLYRVRVGEYRIVYAIQDNIITVTIAKIANRKEVYE
ncbi:MAG: type II toxin-antitoxin system RelE/ParE family toxin [Spirosomataceae bacterium]